MPLIRERGQEPVFTRMTDFLPFCPNRDVATAASKPEVPWPALGRDPSGAASDESREFEAELAPLLGAAMRLATAMRLDRQEAEDAVQEAALRAWRRRGNRRAGTDLRPWFLAIVANQCRESRRSRWSSVLPLAERIRPWLLPSMMRTERST